MAYQSKRQQKEQEFQKQAEQRADERQKTFVPDKDKLTAAVAGPQRVATSVAAAAVPAADKVSGKAGGFPLVSILSKTEMEDVISLMQTDLAYQEEEKALKEARAEIKERLGEIARVNQVPGLRWGQLAVYYNGYKTRRTLSKTALAENGVAADVIERSYVDSKPYLDVRVKDLSKDDSEYD